MTLACFPLLTSLYFSLYFRAHTDLKPKQSLLVEGPD